jgi:hypothetical protein
MRAPTAHRLSRHKLSRMYPVVILMLAAACGTENSPDVGGIWSMSYDHAGGSFACTVQAHLTLEPDGTSLTGNLTEDQATCTNAGQPVQVQLQSFTVSGDLDGNQISFTAQPPPEGGDCAFEAFEGQVAEGGMSGSVETRPLTCQGTFIQLQGTWEAQRLQP